MFTLIIYIVSIYFLIGGLIIWHLNAKADAPTARERSIKFLTYIFIVYGILFLQHYLASWFYIPGAVIVLLGGWEINRVSGPTIKGKTRIMALFTYAIAGFFFMLFCRHTSEQLLWVYMLVLCFDGFSQLSGQLLGKHKLAPAISPGKTIEGSLGGLVISLLTAVALRSFIKMDTGMYYGLALLVITAALGGDLLASYYKRLCQVKDYSALVPGHGGVLDRFDSFIAAGCCFEIAYLVWGN